jgi:hypothetical protein
VQIHRVVARIGIAVGPDACLGHLKPVGLDKPPKLGVVVAGVEVLETLILVIAFADEPLGLDRDGGINVEVRDLAKRPVGGPFDQRPAAVVTVRTEFSQTGHAPGPASVRWAFLPTFLPPPIHCGQNCPAYACS